MSVVPLRSKSDHDHHHDHPHDHGQDKTSYADDHLREGAVVDGRTLTRDVDEGFDFVVIGSGAAGAVAAHSLTELGYAVAIVEEGPWVKTRDFGVNVLAGFQSLMRASGMQVVKGRSYMPLLQGRCVGGSTVVNSAIAWRTPEDVLADWSTRFGLGTSLSMRALEPHFDALERDLNVNAVADASLGENNGRFISRANASGIPASKMRRYDNGCKGSGRCLQGCPTGAKQGMNVSYIPWSLARGARIFTSCRAEHVTVRGRRAVGVVAKSEGSRVDGISACRVQLHARLGVFVAASTIQTPNILRRSGVRARALGRHFQMHPGVAVCGLFDRPIDMGFGATQGAESLHFRASDRFKLETISMPPELAIARMPGAGQDLAARIASYGNVAMWAAQLRARAEGSVTPSAFGTGDNVRYSLSSEDVDIARKACAVIARLLFEEGAREVWPGIAGVPSVIKSHDDVKLIANGPTDPRSYNFIATHLFGAARMGTDPRTSVVGTDFATHDVRALYVVDSSVFPTNLGVNPQHTIMAMSRLAATRIASHATRSMSA
jgi:choline dehydrogenase-like flavoprotein